MHPLMDSTDIGGAVGRERLLEEHGSKTRRAWRTLHVGTDADTGEMVAATLTGSDALDASQGWPPA